MKKEIAKNICSYDLQKSKYKMHWFVSQKNFYFQKLTVQKHFKKYPEPAG